MTRLIQFNILHEFLSLMRIIGVKPRKRDENTGKLRGDLILKSEYQRNDDDCLSRLFGREIIYSYLCKDVFMALLELINLKIILYLLANDSVMSTYL